jgi:acyl-CoA reductase-like NAD-dependent aldehyde dehydrogenase
MTHFDPFVAHLFIDNEYVPAGQNWRDVINPSTLQPCGRIADATPAEIDRAVSIADAARSLWSRLDAKRRAQFLHAVAQSIESTDKHDVALLMTREVGKPYPESVGELANVASAFRYYAEIARDDAGKIAGPTQSGSFQYACYFPYGVSVHIVPYNFPILLMAWTLAASLAAGNVAVVKPAEVGSLCTLKFMEHFRDLPPGVVNLLTGGAAGGKALVESPRTRIHGAFVEGLVRGAKALRVGNGLGEHEIGPLVSQSARDKVIRLIDDAVARGREAALRWPDPGASSHGVVLRTHSADWGHARHADLQPRAVWPRRCHLQGQEFPRSD